MLHGDIAIKGNHLDKSTRLWEIRWVRDICFLIIVTLLCKLVYDNRAITLPIILGLAMAYAFNPLVTFLAIRFKIKRLAATGLIMGIGAIFLSLFLIVIVPAAVGQTKNFYSDVQLKYKPWFVKTGVPWIESQSSTFFQTIGADKTPEQIQEKIKEKINPSLEDGTEKNDDSQEMLSDKNEIINLGKRARDDATESKKVKESISVNAVGLGEVGGFAKTLEGATVKEKISNLDMETLWPIITKTFKLGSKGVIIVGVVFEMVTYIILFSVVLACCFFYFSWKLEYIQLWFKQFIPKQDKQKSLKIISKMDATIVAFMRGRLIQALIMSLVLSVGWYLTGVRYWLFLGLFSGFLNLIPYAAILGCITAVSITAVDHLYKIQNVDQAGQSIEVMVILWPFIIYVIAQLIDGWAVEPIVQGQATDLDPLTVMLVVLLGASMAGLFGMLVAIPFTACLKILGQEIFVPRLKIYCQKFNL